MSTSNAPSDDPGAVTVTVAKSAVAQMFLMPDGVGMDGEYPWPIHPLALLRLYRGSSEHARAIQVKAEGAFGGGLLGDTEAIEKLCPTGAADLFTQLDIDLGTYGNAFIQVIATASGVPVELRRLPAVTMARTASGFVQRVFGEDGQIKKIAFNATEIIHLRDLCPMGGRYALPAWIGGQGMLELAEAAIAYNAAFFKNSAIPEYAVIFEKVTPSEAQKAAIKEFFKTEFQGVDNAHRTLILTTGEEGSVKFEKLTADIKDADFLKLIDAARDRIPVAHGTPPRVLGIVSAGQLGGGGEATGQMFIFEHLTLKPRRRRTLDQLRPFLKRLGLKPGSAEDGLGKGEIAFRPLDLTSPTDDAQNLPALVSAGIISGEEARQLLPDVITQIGTPVARSAPADPIAALAAILAKT